MQSDKKSPVIVGLTSYPVNDDGAYTIPGEYVAAVRRAGGIPVVIPAGNDDAAAIVALLDAVVLIGGGDINPDHYGGKDHATIYNLSEDRDRSELAIAGIVLESRLPTLGICRGLQVVNVRLGGTLHEHLPEVFGERTLHRAPPRKPVDHPHTIEPDSQLAQILGATRVDARSWHHQSVKELAPGFVVVARADDGCIEAIEHPDRPELVCVQWHPELTAGEDAVQQRLFDDLVAKARKHRHP